MKNRIDDTIRREQLEDAITEYKLQQHDTTYKSCQQVAEKTD